jgi:tetratricopeptide (TPR) repeat protein
MRAAALLAAAGALLLAALLGGGASGDSRLLWIGGGAALAAGIAGAAFFLGALPRPSPGHAGTAFLALGGGFVLWSGVTILWSVQPDRSWSYTNRGLAYLAFACLGLFLGAALPRAPRRLAALFLAGFALAIGWALLGKAIPSLYPDYGRIARLRSPIGYWNALAQVCDAALPLGLWLGARRRWAGALVVYGASVAAVLTLSRSGLAIGVLAVVLYLALARDAYGGLLTLAAAVPPAALVAGLAFTQPGLADDGTTHSQRVHAGVVFAVSFLAGAVVAGLLGAWLSRLRVPAAPTRARVVRFAAAGAVIVLLLVVAAGIVRAGGPVSAARRLWHGFATTEQITQASGRLSSANSSNRWRWWQESWDAFSQHSLGGSGAGTFELEHRLVRGARFSEPTIEPHSIALQALGETGIVGFLLLLGTVASGGLVLRAALRRLDGIDRAAAAALAVGAAAWLAHALVDLHWDYIAVTAPVFLTIGALAAAGRPALPARRRPLWALGAVLLAAAAVYSLATPWLANRRLDSGLAALGRGNLAAATSDFRAADRLNPLAVEPLLYQAAVQIARGNAHAAEILYLRARARQPKNPDVLYELGVFEFRQGNYLAAYRALNDAYTLDRFGPAGRKGGYLDRARAIVNREAAKQNAMGTPITP